MIHARPLSTALTGLLLCGLATTGNAASVSLVPTTPTQNVADGDIVSFDIRMDFTGEPTLGGGFNLFFDPTSLALAGFTRDASVGDPAFSRDPDVLDGQLLGWIAGSLDALPETAILGSVSFEVLPTMGLGTVLRMESAGFCGCWAGADFSLQFPKYNPAELSRVPLPATAWLLLTSLAFARAFSRTASATP